MLAGKFRCISQPISMCLLYNGVPHSIHWFIIFSMKNCHLLNGVSSIFRHIDIVESYSCLHPHDIPMMVGPPSDLDVNYGW